MAAAWIIIGAVLSGWAFWRRWSMLERGGRRRRRPPNPAVLEEVAAGSDPTMAMTAFDPREAAMSVLSSPMALEEGGRRGLAVAPARQWRLGSVFGTGLGLMFCGVLLLLFPPAPPEALQPGTTVRRSAVISPSGTAPAGAGVAAGGGTTPAPSASAPVPPLTPPTSQPAISFVVNPGEMPRSVVARLQAEGLIGDESAFLTRLVERKLDIRIRSGKFELYRGMTADEIINALTGGGQ